MYDDGIKGHLWAALVRVFRQKALPDFVRETIITDLPLAVRD
jgi:hypothetical protein|tara:strand:- start:1192 stop:1317 length:126 start_codon:yes stop_codon:yes gene_type:complete